MQLTPEQLTARRKRNVAIAWSLVAFMALMFVVTVLNLKRNIDMRMAGEVPVAQAPVTPNPAPPNPMSEATR